MLVQTGLGVLLSGQVPAFAVFVHLVRSGDDFVLEYLAILHIHMLLLPIVLRLLKKFTIS